MSNNSLLITNAEIYGEFGQLQDIRCNNGIITEIGINLKTKENEPFIDAKGGCLLPGLHDHHIHLMALAANSASVKCGPPEVNNLQQLTLALSDASVSTPWLRGTGYHDSVAGEIDRTVIDHIIKDRPVRIQHRSGKMWIVNSKAAELLDLDNSEHCGIERDDTGKATGRLFRMDNWLRQKMGAQAWPDITETSSLLASYGVTGITDTTPTNSAEALAEFTRAIEGNELLQRVHIMGDLNLPETKHPFITRGAVKLLLDEYQLPDYEQFTADIQKAHQQNRTVAIHCVTQTEIIFALSAIKDAGSFKGDRLEHASVTTDEILPLMQQTGITVVTQPGFIHQRGDHYLKEVESIEQPYLYRLQSFFDSNIPLGGSTDAPYGDPDPWKAIDAAIRRTTADGSTMGEHEKLTPEQAVALFLSSPDCPGGKNRLVGIGKNADLCLLNKSWGSVKFNPSSKNIVATVLNGQITYSNPETPMETTE